MEKVIRDNNVAILISPGFGAGWYSWNSKPEIVFHPKLVEMVEQNRNDEINENWIKDNLGIENIYCGGAKNLKIVWLPIGTIFEIEDYDGAESIKTLEQLTLIA